MISHKQVVLFILALLAFGGTSPATARNPEAYDSIATVSPASETAVAQQDDESALDEIWRIPTLYTNDESGILNELRVVGRLHLDNFVVDARQGEQSDLVIRRSRLGAKARLFGRLEAHIVADLDLEGGALYNRLTNAYLAWRFSEAARVTVGKHSVEFTLDGSTSSNELLTIDRSNVANNFWFTDEYIPGVSIDGSSDEWSYNTGIFSGGRSNSEFGDFEGGYFWLGSLGRDFAGELGVEKALVRADYVYNEPDANSDFTRPFQHIGSLVFVLEDTDWGISGDIVAGDGYLGQSDAYGATLLPWVNLTNRLQLAGRYTFVKSEEPNGVRLPRYENVVASGRGDRYHEVYAGLNYYIYGHRLKGQTGLSYANMRDRAADGGAYDGLTWTTGLRLSW